MPLPRWVARLNKRFVNRLMRPLAEYPPFALLTHVGRRSGRSYQITINAFRRSSGFVIPLTYGRDTDWVRNVLSAARGQLSFGGVDYRLSNPRIVGRAGAWSDLPLAVKPMLWLLRVKEFLLVDA